MTIAYNLCQTETLSIKIHVVAGALHTLDVLVVKYVCFMFVGTLRLHVTLSAYFLNYFVAVSQDIDHTSSCSHCYL